MSKPLGTVVCNLRPSVYSFIKRRLYLKNIPVERPALARLCKGSGEACSFQLFFSFSFIFPTFQRMPVMRTFLALALTTALLSRLTSEGPAQAERNQWGPGPSKSHELRRMHMNYSELLTLQALVAQGTNSPESLRTSESPRTHIQTHNNHLNRRTHTHTHDHTRPHKRHKQSTQQYI